MNLYINICDHINNLFWALASDTSRKKFLNLQHGNLLHTYCRPVKIKCELIYTNGTLVRVNVRFCFHVCISGLDHIRIRACNQANFTRHFYNVWGLKSCNLEHKKNLNIPLKCTINHTTESSKQAQPSESISHSRAVHLFVTTTNNTWKITGIIDKKSMHCDHLSVIAVDTIEIYNIYMWCMRWQASIQEQAAATGSLKFIF